MDFRLPVLGLLTAQAIATIHVRLAGLDHLRRLAGVAEAGYLAVPGPAAKEALATWRAAFCGGLFFTLTIGAGLTLLALLALRLQRSSSPRGVMPHPAAVISWIGLIGFMNIDGFSTAAIAYAVLVPGAVFIGAAWWPDAAPSWSRRTSAVHLIVLLLLAGVGARHFSTTLFSNIRDNLLLSNTAGISINNFYYRHTLQAAQAFKSLDQMQIRTCRIVGEGAHAAGADSLAARLARHDWLAVEAGHPADMVIERNGASLRLLHQGREILTVPEERFAARPGAALKTFAAGVDRSAGLRGFAFVSLMAVGLLGGYGALYLPARWAAGRCMPDPGARIAAAAAAASAGVALLVFAPWEARLPPDGAGGDRMLKAMLASKDARERAAGLAALCRRGRDVGDFGDIRVMARRSDLRERYWLARALAASRHPEALPVLVAMLDDPQINVAYQACHAIGRMGDRRGIAPLLRLIGRSREWYVQRYAYRALRRLGWRQRVSG